MKNFLQVNRASTGAKTNLNFKWLWTDSHEKQSPQRFVRYAAMLIMLLTLGVGQMWAADVTKNTIIYFDNTASNWSYSYTYFVINDTHGWKMSAISNTKLYVHKRTENTWGGYSYIRLAGNGSDWGEGNVMGSYDNMNSYIANFTNTYNNYGFGADNLYYIKPDKAGSKSSQANLSVGHIGSSYTALNKTITVKAKVSENNGGSYSEVTSPATLTAGSYKFTTFENCTTATSLSSGTITCGYTATTTLTAPSTDPSGYKFDGWYNSSGTRETTSKTLTIYPTEDATYYAYYRKLYTIAASSTVVWDLCGNEKSWSAVYLYKDIEGGSASNDAMTQCGSTTQYRKTYASAVSNVKVFLFRAQNGSTWTDYMQTTDLYRNVSGVTLYEFDNTCSGTKLNWQETTGAKKATSGVKVYFDNTATNWGEIWLKYGTTRFNRHTGARATQVTGTANLYVITMPEAYYVKWFFADNYGYTNRYSIETMTSIDNRIGYQTTDLTSDITYIPSTGSGTPKVWNTTTISGHTRTLTFGDHDNGNITVRYTDESGVERTVSSASASSVDVAQTCNVVITAVPNSGYAPSGLTLNSSSITSGATQTIRADGTIDATFVAEETHNVTVSYMYGTRELHDDATFEVGITTASDISSETIDGFDFSAWSDLTGVTNNTGDLVHDPININTIEGGDDGSMTCNYIPWTCSLDLVASEGATGYSSRTAMSYDATEKAYYINRTTASATERYRFFINSIEYSTSSNTELTIDKTKVDANTNVTNYASDKPSVYFNDGPSGSNITIWFDYENKKAWVTEQKHTVTISAGANGSVSPTSVSVGNVVKSGSITATPSSHYHLSSWTIPSGVTLVDGSTTTSPITIKATEDDKEVTASFAGDVYTITYQDKGGSAFSGSHVDSPTAHPTSHTYGTATTLHSATKTGYDFDGWFTTSACTSGTDVTSIGATDKTANFTLYAKWTPKTYAVTFDYDDNGGSKTSGADANNATFDQNTITTPVVYKDGYCLDGWYSAASDGVKVIDKDGNLQPNVSVSETQWTDGDGKWKKDGTATVYAVYTVPTIEMSASPAVLNVKKPEKDTVVIQQTFSCAPTGTYNVVYTVGYSANHTQLAPQPTIIYGTAGYDSIVMPMASANTYEIVAELRTGSTPGSGTLLKCDTINYAVEDEYSVTLHYMVDGVQIRSSRTVSAYPSATETPVEVRVFIEESGYELDYWEMGVGIDTVSGLGSIIDGGSAGPLQSKYIYASNNGNIYLHYKPKTNTVYFFNTFSMYWYSTIMKKYDYGTSTNYWTATNGAGSKLENETGKITPDTVKSTTTDLEEKRWMASIGGSTTNFAFVSEKKDQQHFWGLVAGNEYPKVIYRTDYNAATPMFVPVSTDVTSDYYILNRASDGEAHYYRGFWVKYSPNPDSTGYYLHVYNQKAQSGAELIQTLPLRLSQTGEGGTWELRAVMDLEGGKTYGFKITKATGASTKTWYSYNGTLTAADHEGKVLDGTSDNIGLTTTSAGDYTFHVFCKDFGTKAANEASASDVQGQLAVTVDYATVSGDYRVIYSDATQTEVIASPSIHPVANGQDTVSFFIRANGASRVMKIQKYDTNWADFGDPVDLSSITKDSVYVIYLQQNEAGDDIEVAGYDFYDGDYYIRTDCVDEHKWDYKQSLDNHRMNASDYGMSETQPVQFTHYYVHWVDANQNVKFVVANKYAPCVSDTLITDAYANVAGGNLPNAGASVRFMYNKGTNEVNRAYLAGAQGGAYTPNYLKLRTSTDSLSKATGESAPIDSITFTDLKNFVYQAEIKAKPGLTATLTAQYNGNTQYFKGSELEEEEILGGTTTAWQSLLLTYDFKVNRLICAWQPSGDSIEGNTPINADVMIIRTGQEAAQQIIFKNNDSKLSSVKYIYGVMQFNYDDMVGHMYTWGPTAYELCMYYISFPYDVLVNDIMAPGRMGTEWRIQRYNGAKRAKGWFAGDGVTTFWEDVQSGDTLHAYEGYSLLLNRRIFNDGSSSVWANKGAHSKLYMYFPSKDATTGVVANKTVEVTVPSHECTVDRVFDQDMDKPEAEQRNHKIVDSHWNMIGTPLFENHTAATIVTGPTIEGETLQYIYAWNPAGNSLGIQNTLGTSWEFKTMYSYMAQYAGTITFTGSAVGDVVAAPRRTPKENYTLNLELTKDEMFIGRTYVELRENAVDSFLLNEDVYMVKNGVTADLYTFAGAYEAGANVMSVGSHTIPVGVDVKTAGTYTFSMPDNFDGTVTLIDTYAQTRTNLNIEDYEVTLNKGTINDRFFLEIDIANAPTAIDGASDGQGTLKDGKAHKFIMNDQMYILKDGVIYDARGSRVK